MNLIDLAGAFVLPGLIDGHTHLSDVASGKRALESGVTAVRSAGMGGPALADVGLRDLTKSAALAAPDIFAAGYLLRPRLQAELFLTKPGHWAFEGGLNTVEHVREAVRMNVKSGVD
jgi:imidazolonepropionase-like amidohydrolase